VRGTIVISAGTSADTLIVTNAGCTMTFTVSGSVAQAVPGQTCSNVDTTGSQVTFDMASWTLTISADYETLVQTVSVRETDVLLSGSTLTCTDTDTGATLRRDCNGATLYPLAGGDSCFAVVSVAAGWNDGCKLGVAADARNNGYIGSSVHVNYDPSTGDVTVQEMGPGQVMCNEGILSFDDTVMAPGAPSCTYRATERSWLTMTGPNQFNFSVVVTDSAFAAACPPAGVPPAGQCTSTWTWHMVKSAKIPPNCL
jgi:hypothetical protein